MVADFLSWALVMAMPGPDIISIGLQTSRYGLRAGFWTALGGVVSALAGWYRGVTGRCSYPASRATAGRLRGSRDIGRSGSPWRSKASAQLRRPSRDRIDPFDAIAREQHMG